MARDTTVQLNVRCVIADNEQRNEERYQSQKRMLSDTKNA